MVTEPKSKIIMCIFVFYVFKIHSKKGTTSPKCRTSILIDVDKVADAVVSDDTRVTCAFPYHGVRTRVYSKDKFIKVFFEISWKLR